MIKFPLLNLSWLVMLEYRIVYYGPISFSFSTNKITKGVTKCILMGLQIKVKYHSRHLMTPFKNFRSIEIVLFIFPFGLMISVSLNINTNINIFTLALLLTLNFESRLFSGLEPSHSKKIFTMPTFHLVKRLSC